MHSVLSPNCVSVTELKRNYTQVLQQANNQPVAVLNHNRPEAYLLPAALYEQLLGQLDDVQGAQRVRDERLTRTAQALTALESGQISVLNESADWVGADLGGGDDAEFNAAVFEREFKRAQSELKRP